MAVDKFLVEDNAFVVKDNAFVTVDDPDDCECCDGEVVCPTDCTSCPNTITAVITCPNSTFTNIIFTKSGSNCVWFPDFHTGYNITTMGCILGGVQDPCNTSSPAFTRFAFCISVIPGGTACDTLGTNVDFHKAVASGCPDTGLYVSSKANWTATLS